MCDQNAKQTREGQMRFRIPRQVATFTLAGALVAGFAALTAPANGQQPRGTLAINEVAVEFDPDRITITGEHFDLIAVIDVRPEGDVPEHDQ